MPTVKPGAKVLVSGASGFIACWIVKTLLDKGYAVRGSVRSEKKGEYLKNLFAEHGEMFEIVIVEDMAKDGALDEAVKGVDAIEHTASPVFFAEDPEELIRPALSGTVGILQSALKHGSSVKRIVITSSCATVVHTSDIPIVFSEKDWNEDAVQETKEKGRNAHPMSKYRASKTLAERAAWEFVERNKSQLGWDLVVINPPWVFGPVIHEVSSPSVLNTSISEWYKTVVTPEAGGKSLEALANIGFSWVDVRDLAEAHVLAIEVAAAGGERIIVRKGTYSWQDWIDEANALPSSILSQLANSDLPKGNPGAGSADPKNVHMVIFDTNKAERILALNYKWDKKDTARDIIVDFGKKGW